MTNERIIQIDSVDAYNKLYGWETLHPLVTVVRSALPLRLSKNHANPMASDLNHSRLRSTLVALLAKNYGLYALFLKQGDGCSIRYGREKYDYQEGTVVSFKPGQVVEVEWDKACLSPNYFGDLISKESGTTAQRHIQDAVIERSKQLLVETRLPVSEIAYQLGFEYPQHFSRLFKSRTGMTPNEYRLTASRRPAKT